MLVEPSKLAKLSGALSHWSSGSNTLYLTMLGCKATSLLDLTLMWTALQTILIQLSILSAEWEYLPLCPVRPKLASWLCLLCVFFLSHAFEAFKKAMQPRIPMLIVRLHHRF